MTFAVRPPSLPGADPHGLMRRPGVITLISVFYGLFGLMMLLAGVAFVVPGAGQPGLMAIGGVCIALAVVELAMGVGAAIAIPNFLTAVQRAKQKRAAVELQDLGRRLEDFDRATGSYPAVRSVVELSRALAAGQTATLSTTDPWGHPYLYYAWKKNAAAAG